MDHINCDPTDNRLINLRLATRSQNMANLKRRGVGLKGAYYDKTHEVWVSYIHQNKKQIYLGHFATDVAAHEAYKKAAVELYGEFARFG